LAIALPGVRVWKKVGYGRVLGRFVGLYREAPELGFLVFLREVPY
jgi:hypothetical protein